MDSNPKELEPFVAAYKLKLNMKDQEMWVMGMYVLSAVTVAVERVLNGKKAKSKYLEEPITKNAAKEKTPITEAEKKKATDMLFMQLQIMQTNFELNKKGKAKGN